MDNVDLTPIIGIVTKGGPAAIIIALFYGLAMLVREVRAGKVSAAKEADLTKRLETLEGEMAVIKTGFASMQAANHALRYQRDQARVRVEYLEQKHNENPRTVWTPDAGKGEL
ncbi:hypothetical protein ACFFLM_04335 [Deinococcus oregonensis]|uniref:Uncharacterized protein n=1 Tax=Deinococcus oregonensis TaxID=1805970 RepID=A0ABV6AUU6_9DEIO